MIVRSAQWNLLLVFSALFFALILQVNQINCQDDGDGDDGDDGDDAGAAGAAAAGGNPLANNPYISTLTSIYSVVPEVLGTVTRLSNSANMLLNGTDTPNVGSFIFKQSLNAAELIQTLQRMNQANQAQGGGAGGGGGGFQLPAGIPGFLGGLPGLSSLPSGIPGFGSFGAPASPPVRKPEQNPWPGGNPYAEQMPGDNNAAHKPQGVRSTSPQPQTDLDADYYPLDEDYPPVAETTTVAPTRKPRPRTSTTTVKPVEREAESTTKTESRPTTTTPPTNIIINSVMPDKASLWNIYKSYHSRPEDTNGMLNHFQLAHPGAFSNDLIQNLISSISPVHEQISQQSAPPNKPFSELLKRPPSSSNEESASPPKISYPPASSNNIFNQSPGITWSGSKAEPPVASPPKSTGSYLYPPVSLGDTTTDLATTASTTREPPINFNRPLSNIIRPSSEIQRPVFNIQRPYPDIPNPSTVIQNPQPHLQNLQNNYQNNEPPFQNPPPTQQNPSYPKQNTQPAFQNHQLNYQNPQANFQNPQPNYQNPQPNFQNLQPNFQNSQSNLQNPQHNLQSLQPNLQNAQHAFQNPSPTLQNSQVNVQTAAPTYQNPSVTKHSSSGSNNLPLELTAPPVQNIETSAEVISPTTKPKQTSIAAHEVTDHHSSESSPSRPPSMIMNAILSSDPVKKQPVNSKLTASKPAYWMNMYYPGGLPVLTKVVSKEQDSSSIREPRI